MSDPPRITQARKRGPELTHSGSKANAFSTRPCSLLNTALVNASWGRWKTEDQIDTGQSDYLCLIKKKKSTVSFDLQTIGC